MPSLSSCSRCSGFLGLKSTVCPHCGAPTSQELLDTQRGRIVRGVVAAATGGAVALTLMACYGSAPVDGPIYYDDAGSDGRVAQDAQVANDAPATDAADAADAPAQTDGGDASDAALDADARD